MFGSGGRSGGPKPSGSSRSGGSALRSWSKTAQTTASNGIAMIAPKSPPRNVPAVTPSATTTGWSDTCLPITSGWRMWPSIWPIRATPTVTIRALTKPPVASATTAATSMAAGAPINGTKAPTNTRTASGAASGTPTINSIMAFILLLIVGVPLAAPLAVLVFVGAFVPLIGAPAAMVVAAVVALATGGFVKALIVTVGVALIGQIEGHILQPLVMGKQVSLHPVVVALGVTAGTFLGGLFGAIIAIPLLAVVWAVFDQLRNADPPLRELPEGFGPPERPPLPNIPLHPLNEGLVP